MPLKIPPFTPVAVQPTAAEPFSTFVSNTPSALTPLTGAELVPIIQNGASKHVPPNTVGFGPPVRTILTANTNYYVTTTGSDANDGSLANPWATLQHALQFIAANLDIAGFTVTINIGAGTFVGAGTAGAIGGGTIKIVGAGTASTFLTGGPNDGNINFGEVLNVNLGIGATILEPDLFTFRVPKFSLGLAAESPGVFIFASINGLAFDLTTTGADSSYCISCGAPGALVECFGPMSVVGPGSGNFFGVLEVFNGGVIQNLSAWTLTGTPVFQAGTGFANVFPDSLIVEQGSSYTGSATGTRFFIQSGAIAGSGTNSLGLNWYPGSAPGTCDAVGSYDGRLGPLPNPNTRTTNYTLVCADFFNQVTDVDTIVEMNSAGANTVTVPLDGTGPSGTSFQTGEKCFVTQIGTGTTTIAGAVGVTVHNAGSLVQWQTVKLYKRGTNEWVQTNA